MVKKKKAPTPQPKKSDNSQRNYSKNATPTVTEEEDNELITPPSNIVHPQAGPITRKEAAIIAASSREMFGEVQSKELAPPKSTPQAATMAQARNSSNPNLESNEPGITEKHSKWSNLFKKSSNAKGMTLGFVPPCVHEGKTRAKLKPDEIEKGGQKWSSAMILYVIGMKPTFTAITRYIEQTWTTVSKPDTFLHDEGYFIIKFQSKEELHEVLYSGPHMIYGRPMIVKAWAPNFNFNDEILRTIPLWVRLPNLPLNCWSSDSLSRLGSVVGVPVCADEYTTNQSRISYARLLIEVDITKELIRTIPIENEEGKLIEQQVFYEWTPAYCTMCKKIGHDCKNTKPPPPKQKTQMKWVPKNPATAPTAQPQAAEKSNTATTAKPPGDPGEWNVVTRKKQAANPPAVITTPVPTTVPCDNSYVSLSEDDDEKEYEDDDEIEEEEVEQEVPTPVNK